MNNILTSLTAQLLSTQATANDWTLGTERYYVLIDGTSTGDNDDRILDVKLQVMPAPAKITTFVSTLIQNKLLFY